MLFLSYALNQNTPTYGNRNQFKIVKNSDIDKGDVANDSFISTTVHIGTHIDMPYHFHKNGQTIDSFDADYWIFNAPLVVEISPKSLIIKDELIEILKGLNVKDTDILIVKTGICYDRGEQVFWEKNYGLDPALYIYLLERLPSLRVIGFDSISISSFAHRLIGREAHKVFLNPEKPLLILEDMDLRKVDKNTDFKRLIVSPLRIEECDGLPCTVFGELND